MENKYNIIDLIVNHLNEKGKDSCTYKQIDEISKDVLARYVPTSVSAAGNVKYVQGRQKTLKFPFSNSLQRDYNNRIKGIDTAVKKMGGENTREGDYIKKSAKDYGGIEYLQGRRAAAAGRPENLESLEKEKRNREIGVNTAVKKLYRKTSVNNEEVINELSANTLTSYISKARESNKKAASNIDTKANNPKNKTYSNPSIPKNELSKDIHTVGKRIRGIGMAKGKLTNEEVINETLPSNASASDYIDDFVHSNNKMFKGDSKQKRIRRALGAYYGKQHAVKEENIKNVREGLMGGVEPLIGEDGKKKKSKVSKESGPDFPIQLGKGIPNRFQNIGRDTAQSI